LLKWDDASMTEEDDPEFRYWHLKCPECEKWIYRPDFARHREREMSRAKEVDKLEKEGSKELIRRG
jgi:hypothetical protein